MYRNLYTYLTSYSTICVKRLGLRLVTGAPAKRRRLFFSFVCVRCAVKCYAQDEYKGEPGSVVEVDYYNATTLLGLSDEQLIHKTLHTYLASCHPAYGQCQVQDASVLRLACFKCHSYKALLVLANALYLYLHMAYAQASGQTQSQLTETSALCRCMACPGQAILRSLSVLLMMRACPAASTSACARKPAQRWCS